jgi:hypothetical protein
MFGANALVKDVLPRGPGIILPITSPGMFTEDDMRPGEPTIVVNEDPRVWRVAVLLLRMPAHVSGTYNRRRGRQETKSQSAGSSS